MKDLKPTIIEVKGINIIENLMEEESHQMIIIIHWIKNL